MSEHVLLQVANIFIKYMLKTVFSFIYTKFLYSLWSVTSGLWQPFPLACAMGHTAAFTVNAALVASQWQHWFDLTRNQTQSYQLWWQVLNQLGHLTD